MIIKVLIVLFLSTFILSCDPNEPEVTFCQLNPQEFSAYCIDSKDGDEYEQPLSRMNGWISTSPEDFGALKKHYKKLKSELESCRDN